jgi:hypothetical protein
MSVLTLEGVVEEGRIKLDTDVALPERARVYVVIPQPEILKARIVSPRLVHPEQAVDFKMTVTPQADA